MYICGLSPYSVLLLTRNFRALVKTSVHYIMNMVPFGTYPWCWWRIVTTTDAKDTEGFWKIVIFSGHSGSTVEQDIQGNFAIEFAFYNYTLGLTGKEMNLTPIVRLRAHPVRSPQSLLWHLAQVRTGVERPYSLGQKLDVRSTWNSVFLSKTTAGERHRLTERELIA